MENSSCLLTSLLQENVKIRVHDNRSTMLRVCWEKENTKVSLHRFFLQAPPDVVEALVGYVVKRQKQIPVCVKSFITEQLQQLDYSHRIDSSSLTTQGEHYDLEAVYNEINARYFHNKLQLRITWYGRRGSRRARRQTFGTYDRMMKLIKIHRLLDRREVPHEVVAFVIYHEMLHHVCLSYVDERGVHHVHTKEFKRREKLFEQYSSARQWMNRYDRSWIRRIINVWA